MPAHLLQFLGPDSRELTSISTEIIHGVEIPNDWRESWVVLILKPSGKADSLAYRNQCAVHNIHSGFERLGAWAEFRTCPHRAAEWFP